MADTMLIVGVVLFLLYTISAACYLIVKPEGGSLGKRLTLAFIGYPVILAFMLFL